MNKKWIYFSGGVGGLLTAFYAYSEGDIYWGGWLLVLSLVLVSAPLVIKNEKND